MGNIQGNTKCNFSPFWDFLSVYIPFYHLLKTPSLRAKSGPFSLDGLFEEIVFLISLRIYIAFDATHYSIFMTY